MKTAMQELWEYIDANYHEEGFNLYDAKEISLEKEKEQMIKFGYGFYDECFTKDGIIQKSAGEYYNQTYNK